MAKAEGGKKSGPSARKQELARRKLFDYIARLGKRKAARRLDTTVAEVERWLRSRKIPTNVLPEAIGLGVLGGGFTYIPGTDLGKTLKRLGAKRLSALTGIPGERLKEIARKRPGVRIKVSRSRLAKAASAIGWQKLARSFNAEPEALERVSRYPKSEATKRLAIFVRQYGEERVKNFLGITYGQLDRWLKKNVPKAWENDISRIVGKRADEGKDETDVSASKTRPIKKLIERAKGSANAWNKAVPRKYRITKRTAEQWARLGEWQERFQRVKEAYEEARRAARTPLPKKPRRPPPPPVKPPPPAPPPLFPTKPPPLPRPPTRPVAPPISQALEEQMSDFLAKRAEALASGEGSKNNPLDPFHKFTHWQSHSRQGIRYYGKVRQFVILLNLTTIGNQIIRLARQIWDMANTIPISQWMTIRYTFSIQGAGNPFYPAAFEPTEQKVTFATRNTEVITEPHDIERQVRSVLSDAWEIAQEHLLFFEHYEIVKSTPRIKQLPMRSKENR